jgi:hypothetical protein
MQAIQAYLGYRKATGQDLRALTTWLLDRALEHDTPALLYALACEELHTAQCLRPGITRLERLQRFSRDR